MTRNTDRLAAVWLDDYIRFYHRKMGKRDNFGDISAVSKYIILMRKKDNVKIDEILLYFQAKEN